MRRPSALLPAAVGAGAALLALSTLGLTWVERAVEGPLGSAGGSRLEQLSGRDVAPLVAALVPGVTAVVVVGLLLRGRWRVLPLLLASLGAGAAGLSAAAVAVAGDPQGGTTTAAPVVAGLACLVAACCAAGAAVLAWRPAPQRAPPGRAPVQARSRGVGGDHLPGQAPQGPQEPQEPQDLWRELDEGRDPTQTP